MPSKTTTSGLAARLGNKLTEAHNKHKDDPIKADGGERLPDGIEMGVAELDKIGFGIFKDGDNKGKDYFMASAVVRLPKIHNGMDIEGLQTRLGPIPLCDTPNSQGKKKTFDDHYNDMLQVLKKLGVDTTAIGPGDLESTVAALQQMADEGEIHFRFRTWKGKPTAEFPNPRVNEVWGKRCDGQSEDPAAATQDDTGGTGGDEAVATASDNGTDLDALADRADNKKDGAAANQLDTLAKEAGLNQKTIDGAASWAEVVTLIREASGGEETEEEEPAEEEEEAEEVWSPEVGTVYKWRDPKAKKHIEVVCKVVDEDKQTVDVVDNSNKKRAIKGIKWSALIVL